jgi:type IX secretion system PorP/SprF family membrane protein
MKKIKDWTFMFSCLLISLFSDAQDFQYSQPFEASMYLNPSFTGSSNFKCTSFKNRLSGANFRFSSLTRSQWNGKFIGNFIGLEHGIVGSNWSFGTFIQIDRLTQVGLNNQYFALISSYTVSDDDLILKFGYQFGVGNRFLGKENFDFADEFNGAGFDYATTSENPSLGISKMYIDYSSIGLNLRKGLFSIGLAAHHLTQPRNSLWGGDDRLDRKFSVQFIKGIELQSFKESRRKAADYFYFVGTFKNQGTNNQLDLGAFLEIGRRIYGFHFQKFSLGSWFRGVPIKKSPDNFGQRDVVVVQVAWQRDLLRFSYSYDIPVSRSRVFGRSHEISISYQFSNGQCRDKLPPPPLPCSHETRKTRTGGIKTVWREMMRRLD